MATPTSNPPRPRRGEVWLVDFTSDAIGFEMTKIRPSVVISTDFAHALPVKLVVPLTTWNDGFAGKLWHVQIRPSRQNGLDRVDSADVLSLRSVDTRRFIVRKGRLQDSDLREILAAIAAVIEYE